MLHQKIERVLSRVVPQTNQSSYIALQNRITSTRTFASHTSRFRSVSRIFYQPQSRKLSSTGRRCSNGNYNRFNNSGRGPRAPPLIYHLLSRARTGHFVIIGLGASAFYYYNTEVVEMTGRRRLNFISVQHELELGEQAYREILAEHRDRILPDSHPDAKVVHRVLERLIPQARVEGAQWRAHVIKADNVRNAFVLPGGKVFVFTGILPFCRDEDGLAAVLGHEIAHVVAHHSAEGMTRNYLLKSIVTVVSFLFDISAMIPAYLSHYLINLPNSRVQEAEADDMGLIMMARACYNPEAAIAFWQRLVNNKEEHEIHQFLSTHPSNESRIHALSEKLNTAQAIYLDGGCKMANEYMPDFRRAFAYHREV
ncbi:hypothetical protein ASPACDRAFT_75536 [Aspergillus aculeatus ATCC 16872]|uniref:Peptidase M48 domain-containing protein n=1 Tax=Aspergillus aculeatus (strain ATCC 16872 / CBS 172.66 / WB 5094) TaxID=690307 RepID=A0A1L9X6G7_ASPA1|nr:uncharacterized protein ASPACDRAFT_75536 [Aspergillus aculeatus ATCC 16872]OJK04045.1 hypothetical protein ASPACDRAFT_75536 [Aspergillus aculeatus ATCC 16872]